MSPKDVDDRAELVVRRYFDHFLEDVMPKIIEHHNRDRKAHGGAEKKINKLLWGIGGIIALAGFIATLKAIHG